MDTSRRFNEDRTGEKSGDVGSWPIKIMQSQPLNHPSQNQTVRDFRDEISYKNGVLPL